MSNGPWILYGATGYTGRLIAELAMQTSNPPILAGRTEESLKAIANRFHLPYRVFALDSQDSILKGISGTKAVLNCAGPFSRTAKPLVSACLSSGAHYFDITGEIDVFESIFSRTHEAKSANVCLIPGVGFDVVPSDCLAALLAAELPNADTLELAFAAQGGISPGTLKTMMQNAPLGGKVRRGGKIVTPAQSYEFKEIPFSHQTLLSASIPWGDVSTAFYSTGIPNISTFAAIPKGMRHVLPRAGLIAPLLRVSIFQKFLEAQIDRFVKGPDETSRKSGRARLWGKVSRNSGESVEATLDVPEGYTLTAQTALKSVEKVLSSTTLLGGAYTPSLAFGARFILEFPHTSFKLQR